MNNTPVFTLASLVRVKAYCRVNNISDEDEVFVLSSADRLTKKWFINGSSDGLNNIVDVSNIDVKEALLEADITLTTLDSLDVEECRMLMEICYLYL
jgi:hypothetical protein